MYVRSYPDTLCHYGVKGMKWGIRRKRNTVSSGRRTSNGSSSKSSKSNTTKSSSSKIKTAAKIGAAAAGVALAAYGGYKMSRYINTKNFEYHMEKGEQAVNDLYKRTARRGAVLGKEVTTAVKVGNTRAIYKAQRNQDRFLDNVSKATHNIIDREAQNAANDSVADKIKNTYRYVNSNRRKKQ